MTSRRVAMYFAWSRPDETSAPLGRLENRFPALFELRRLFWPHYEKFADPVQFDQGIGGFLDNIQRANFVRFIDLAGSLTGQPVRVAERQIEEQRTPLDGGFLDGIDTLIVIGFDSRPTDQQASPGEIAAIRAFLAEPGHMLFVCPHHDIGNADDLPEDQRQPRREAEFYHHGDPAIPAQQQFGGFGLSLLAGLGLPVRNRFGLRPAKAPDGSSAPLEIDAAADRFGLLDGVASFNLHPHLPHFELLGDSATRFDVLARQDVDLTAPPHPFVLAGGHRFNALLQTRPDVCAGSLLVCDTTLWSSTAGGVESLQRFWRNVVQRA